MTNIGRHRLGNAREQNHSIRRCDCDTARLTHFHRMDTDRISRRRSHRPGDPFPVISVMLSPGRMPPHAAVRHCMTRREGISHGRHRLLHEVSDGLATITLNRPEAMNALNIETKVGAPGRGALRGGGRRRTGGAADRGRGARAFCVGQDLKEHIGLLAADRETGAGRTMSTVREHYNPIVRALVEARKPVVAAVNGVAAGAGLGFALAADYRIVADTAAFNTSFAGVALTADSASPGRCRASWCPGRAGRPAAVPASASARRRVRAGHRHPGGPRRRPARRARREDGAARWPKGPTVAYAALKEAMAYGLTHSLSETLDKEDELQSRAGPSEDHADRGAERSSRSRQPKYLGR